MLRLGPGPAEIEAEMAALREAFDGAGIEYTVEVDDELGVGFVECDFDDEAANEVAESVFDELWDDEVDLSDEDLAELRTEIEAEMVALREAFDGWRGDRPLARR